MGHLKFGARDACASQNRQERNNNYGTYNLPTLAGGSYRQRRTVMLRKEHYGGILEEGVMMTR